MWASSMRAVPCGPSSSRQRAILQAGQASRQRVVQRAAGQLQVGRSPWAGHGPSSRLVQPAGHPPGGSGPGIVQAGRRGMWAGRPPAGRRGMWAASQRAVGRPSSGRRACHKLTCSCQVDIMTLISRIVARHHADIARFFGMAGFYHVSPGPIRAARGTRARDRATRQGRPSSDLAAGAVGAAGHVQPAGMGRGQWAVDGRGIVGRPASRQRAGRCGSGPAILHRVGPMGGGQQTRVRLSTSRGCPCTPRDPQKNISRVLGLYYTTG